MNDQNIHIKDAIGVMKEINDCKAILDLGKVITSGSSLANVEQENTAVVKNDINILLDHRRKHY